MGTSGNGAAPGQHEVTSPGPLHDASGRLAEPGFSRRELLAYDPRRTRLTPLRCLDRLRLKEWEFYAAMSDRHRLSVAVAHGGLAGVVAVEWIDFAARARVDAARLTPLGRGVRLPRSSEAGEVRFCGRGGVEVRYRVDGGRRAIDVAWPRFRGGEALDARLVATASPGQESLFVATPIGARGYFYERKLPGLTTTGAVAIGAERVDLGAEGALTTLDWGRGIWPYRTFWIWAAGAGRLASGQRFGLNLGVITGDPGAATENAVFVDGRLVKLGRVDFERDRDDSRRPWRLRAADGRLDLVLEPTLYTTRQRLNAGVIASDLFQTTGAFRGHVIVDEGERLDLDEGSRVLGWAEEHHARW